MAYDVAYTATVLKQLRKLDPPLSRRILDYMDEIAALPDPRSRGKGLVGDRSGFWRYRVGDYRVLCDLDDNHLRILALEVGHRSQIYD